MQIPSVFSPPAPSRSASPVPAIATAGGRTLATQVRTSWRAQLLLFAAAYGIYNLARWITVGDTATATAHAHWIVDRERSLGVAIEGPVQRALDVEVPIWLLSNIYLAAQFVVLPGALIWLYRSAPPVYRVLRNTVLATWLIAIPIYALFPVAPPRLADIGIVDTVSAQAGVALSGRSTMFYNPLAAVPSLHAGFAVAVGVAVALAVRRRWVKALALLWGPTVALAVVATGNHFVFDIVAGLIVTVAGFAAGRLVDRRRQPASARSSSTATFQNSAPLVFSATRMSRR